MEIFEKQLEKLETEEYKLGFELGSMEDYKKKFGEPVGGSISWVNFMDGQLAKKQIIRVQKYSEYKLDEFLVKLRKLCAEYSVSFHFGCGCCDSGARCKDLDFSFEVE